MEEQVVLEQPYQQSDIIPGSAAPREAVSSNVSSGDGGLAVAENSLVSVGLEVVDGVDRSPQSLGPRRSARVSQDSGIIIPFFSFSWCANILETSIREFVGAIGFITFIFYNTKDSALGHKTK